MSTKKQQEQKKFWVRAICLFLVILLAGSSLLALLEVFFSGYLPQGIGSYQTAFTFLVLILVLLIRPNGLFGSSARERS